MADRSAESTQTQEPQHTTTEQQRGQSSFDSSFEQMVTGGIGAASPALSNPDLVFQLAQAYIDNNRRTTDMLAQQVYLDRTIQQISAVVVPQVARQLISWFQQNPEWLTQLTQQKTQYQQQR